METEKLIRELAKNATPVKKVGGPIRTSLVWLAISLAYLAVMVGILGIREDLANRITDTIFKLELLLVLIGGISASFAASILSVPDSYQKERVKWIPLIPFILLTILLAGQVALPEIQQFSPYISKSTFSFACMMDMLIFSILPIMVMLFSIKKAATTQSIWCSAMASLAAVNLSYFALRIIEANDMAVHLLFWHYLPMLLVVAVGIAAGKKLLRW